MARIKRLSDDAFTDIASRYPFNRATLAKDYYATVTLYLLKDIDGLHFKGGTALQKIFLNYARLSEDVDYTVTGNLEEVKEEITRIVTDSGLFESVTLAKDVDGFSRLVLHYTNFDGMKDVVFIDLNRRAKLLKQPEIHAIPHFYGEEIPPFSVSTLAAQELCAEKLAATIGRNKPRDHFDVYMIIKKGLRLDYAIAEKKCRDAGDAFDLERLFNKAKQLHNRWDDDMVPLLAEEIGYQEVIQTLAKHFDLKRMKGERT